MNDLAKAKVNLYRLMLEQKDLTEAEINIAYALAKDDDVQAILTEALAQEMPMKPTDKQ